ncbi:MAG: Bifunctional protein PutA [Chlamydiales bacterium]|nr:Bifunctional protein PutA [Chlamydiales bacterium]MCH9619558.1 Bifunctional protein PutA [Chlamydiales bacterium]MCH9623164.1 Bifunctional protein PutA [Chlamydiales bacterium]
MMRDPNGRLFMTEMTDLCYRSRSARRTVDQLVYLIKDLGIPRFLDENERGLLLSFRFLAPFFPSCALFLLKQKIQKELACILKQEHKKNIRNNINHLGEAILSEEEADRRLHCYLDDLSNPEIDYISVKISTLYSQINLFAFEETLEALATRLRTLYRACSPNQFINLDMEESRDLDLTVALFKKVLSESEFHQTKAGIALQSYLPESFPILKELIQFSIERNGAPIKIRIVKGANLPMEICEASIKGWRQAPFEKKVLSDANFKRMLQFAISPEHAPFVHIGVGSHNLFDIAYAYLLREEAHLKDEVSFEMLGGMAPGMQRALLKWTDQLLLYTPKVEKKHFRNAIPYLIRRLDENGGAENFLHHFYHLKKGNLDWEKECSRFREAYQLIDDLPTQRQRRTRLKTLNEPDLDFSLPENRKWKPTKKIYGEIPLVIGGKIDKGERREGIDPSTCEPFYHYCIATVEQIDEAFASAKPNDTSLEKLPQLFRKHRLDLIEAMVADGGKTVFEADPEISEAIDFITYYQKQWDGEGAAKGTILVAPPWNFPAAIPVSGIAASLITGNSVIFKPAPEAVLVGWLIVQLFWEAGISKRALQFINCDENRVGHALVQHPKLAAVILTGGTETARSFKKLRPSLDLMAETGGKNSLIVTSMADRDLAVRDAVFSAFSHAGQKCSACSLLILEKELYDDPDFLRQLKEATTSLPIGSSWKATTAIPPLIRPLNPQFLKLEKGERWLVKPKNLEKNLWSPGIKLGVKKGSFTHQTEFFAPILGVMCAEDLFEAIEFANGTPYGLTSGLHSLDPREQNQWKEQIVAGNLYINRAITGAIVGRQPFGGCKASTFGFGMKVGGPHYLKQFVDVEDNEDEKKEILPQSVVPLMMKFKLSKEEQAAWKKSAESYAYWHKKFTTPIDHYALVGQQNLYYMVPKEKVIVRSNTLSQLELIKVLTALHICQTPYLLSEESEEEFLEKMDSTPIRLLSPSDKLEKWAAEKGATLLKKPIHSSGSFELLNYLREISFSFDYHRYGYVKDTQSRATQRGNSP